MCRWLCGRGALLCCALSQGAVRGGLPSMQHVRHAGRPVQQGRRHPRVERSADAGGWGRGEKTGRLQAPNLWGCWLGVRCCVCRLASGRSLPSLRRGQRGLRRAGRACKPQPAACQHPQRSAGRAATQQPQRAAHQSGSEGREGAWRGVAAECRKRSPGQPTNQPPTTQGSQQACPQSIKAVTQRAG